MNTHTVIIGGGISGLSAANFLYKKTSNFIIVESDKRPGGIINTSLEGGYICENGPNTILDNNPAIIELLKDLNVHEDLIYANNEKIKKRYLLVNDRLTKIPMNFFDFVDKKSNFFDFTEKKPQTGFQIHKTKFLRHSRKNQFFDFGYRK